MYKNLKEKRLMILDGCLRDHEAKNTIYDLKKAVDDKLKNEFGETADAVNAADGEGDAFCACKDMK